MMSSTSTRMNPTVNLIICSQVFSAGEAGFSWEGGGKIDDRKGHSKTLCLTLRVSFARFAILKCGECKAT